jgi:hypothetical protein
MSVPQPLHNIPYITLVERSSQTLNGTIESDFEWPTPINDVRPIVTEPLRIVTSRSRNQWIQSLHITHSFDHKANMYSKPMAIATVCIGIPCHTMQIILFVFYMHVILQVSLD